MPSFRLEKFLLPEHVVFDVEPGDKPTLIRTIAAAAAAQLPGTDESEIGAQILERELVQSTGIGCGFAIPHGMVPGVTESSLFVFRLAAPADYDALDQRPVDLLFLLLSPPDALKVHVRLLARLARIIGMEGILDQLRAAPDPEAAHRILLDEDARHVY